MLTASLQRFVLSWLIGAPHSCYVKWPVPRSSHPNESSQTAYPSSYSLQTANCSNHSSLRPFLFLRLLSFLTLVASTTLALCSRRPLGSLLFRGVPFVARGGFAFAGHLSVV